VTGPIEQQLQTILMGISGFLIVAFRAYYKPFFGFLELSTSHIGIHFSDKRFQVRKCDGCGL
jgi:hypothetical protein